MKILFLATIMTVGKMETALDHISAVGGIKLVMNQILMDVTSMINLNHRIVIKESIGVPSMVQ